MSKVSYSKDADALLIELSDGAIDHAEQHGNVILHLSSSGAPVLLEILDARQLLLASLRSVLEASEVGRS